MVLNHLKATAAVKNRVSETFLLAVYWRKNKILGAFEKLREVIISFVRSLRLSFCLPAHMEKLIPTGWIFIKCRIRSEVQCREGGKTRLYGKSLYE